ncbi:MAG: PKD domain-containing protein [Ginsengibacter sp.]
MRTPFVKKIIVFFVGLLAAASSTKAQLQASFSTDITGICSPLTVHFTNTTNASSAAVYHWDFGNGNTSALKNPAAVFLDPNDYTVTLTVTDGSQKSTASKTITVYKKPVVDFSSSLRKVCTPGPTTFIADATAENGSISSYTWDFGDGSTQTSYSSQVQHVYQAAQIPPVRLSVTDSHGCTSSKTISNIITVYNGITAAFGSDKTFICFQPDPVQMINQSQGEGPMSYSWDFGDGKPSTQKDPSHVFSKPGAYTVRLAVENPNGCTDTLIKTSYLNVGNFNSQLEVPAIICQNTTIEIKNTSTPTPSSFSMIIDSSYTVYPDYTGRYFYTFKIPGQHTITLNNHFGGCDQSITKKVEVNALLQPNGFVVNIPKHCFPPVTVNFQDTTEGAVKSEWNFINYYPPTIQGSGKTTSYTFNGADTWNVTLYVTDSNGCRNSISKPVTITQPRVYITMTDYAISSCDTLTKKFKMYSNVDLASFTWDFGDGITSTDTLPEHTFSSGSFAVKLKYTTSDGCSAQTDPIDITVYSKPKANFVSNSGTTICGPTQVTFSSNSQSQWSTWYVNDQWYNSGSVFNCSFPDTGKYTITMIASNPGCSDTMVKTNYITVLPSFPQITQLSNTCDGDRGTVTFNQASRYAKKWIWDFGDGTTTTLNSDMNQVSHHYARSGKYQITLTTTNNACTNLTAIQAIVLLKQQPHLSASKTTICSEEPLNYTLTNLDVTNYTGYTYSFYYYNYQYKDGTTFLPQYYNGIDNMPYNGSVTNLQQGKDSFRILTRSYMGCADTSNFIPVKIKGAIAGFKIISDNQCFHEPVTFYDTSSAQNTTITSRQWDFGDGKTLTTTSGGTVSHTYANPGSYNVRLSISDAGGCTSSTSNVYHFVSVNGPKAAFTNYGTSFHMDVPVQFYNQTNNYSSYNTTYQWNFGDGSTSTDYYPSHIYTKPGNYTVTLTVQNHDTGCGDTVSHTITIVYFNANFSFTPSFISSSECSQVVVQFVNTSHDYASVAWDFGDGFSCGNVNTPSHVYDKTGKYMVQLFVTGNNGLKKTYTDTVVIKENQVQMSASMNHTCTAQSVTVHALSGDASSYLWDFGDGTVVQATDSFSVHYYKTPGDYIPQLVTKDVNGCGASATLTEKISIDSLNVSLAGIPQICTPKEVQFQPAITNIGSDGGQQPLIYHWDFGTSNKADTANTETPSFTYQQPGNYTASLQVLSADGCTKKAQVNIVAKQGLGGQINGPSEICVQSAAQFTGSTLLPGQPQWQWIFEDGTKLNQQNPPSREYDSAGTYMVKLVVNNNACIDTVTSPLTVHPVPGVTLSTKAFTLCQGSSFSITAGGGVKYAWSPATGLDDTNKATVNASPVTNTDYVVKVSNTYGCSKTDSVAVNVISPFTLQLANAVQVCSGNSISLQASGGETYRWITNTEGLNNTTIANPVASPTASTNYTVVAFGENQCFSDTANVQVTVKPTPVVNLGNDTTICEGQSVLLNAFIPNATYEWQDGTASAEYEVSRAGTYSVVVNLDNCTSSGTVNIKQTAKPYFTLGKDSAICNGETYVIQPSLNTPATFLWKDGSTAPSFAANHEGIYFLTATNECGSHTDSITITKSLCNILMPSGFTPNGDGLNDVFRVKYPFAVTHFHFIVTDRWGQAVFETTDIHRGWDGTFKGEPAVAGIYVWVISFTDIDGHDQQLKGTIDLIR